MIRRAAKRIKGITIELDGDATKLDKALEGINKDLDKTQSSLTDVNRLLKLDPKNTVLLTQKQDLLTQAIEQTEEKLKVLESTQDQVTASFKSGDIGQEQYMAFQREVEATRSTLAKYKNDLSAMDSEQQRLAQNTQRLQKLMSALGQEVDDYADVLGTRLTNAIKDGTANSDQLRTAIEKIGKSAAGGKGDIKQLTEAIDTVDDGTAIKNLIDDLKKAGEAAQQTADDVGEIQKTTKGEAMMQAADQLSVVGDKIKEVGTSAIDTFSQTESAVSKVNAYFGETGEAAGKSADTIKDVYASGVGDSMDAVSDAVITVRKNIEDLDGTQLTNLTKQALKLEELYGIDMNETMRGVNSLMTQFGLSAQEAMDYIVRGTQNGLDKTNELGDNLSEYAGKFEQAGYSASEYFQLLQNGLEGGAYNLDKVNDAINEVTTRLADGTIADAIGMYSSETQRLFEAWKNGGATQKQVIDSIVSDIAGCTNQQEALNMAAKAFGTMAEDGNLKFISSLTSVGDTYKDVGNSAQNMFDQTQTPMQEMEANTRKLKQSLEPLGEKLVEIANTVIPPLVAAIETISGWFSALPEPIQNFVIILGGLVTVFTALAPVIAAVSTAMGALNISILPVIGVIAGVTAAIAVIITAIQNWGTITEWFGGVWETAKEVVSNAINTIVGFFTETIPNAISGFVATVQNLFSGMASTLQGIWDGIVQIASGAWELLKNTILAPVLLLIDLVTGIFDKLKSDAENIWKNIQQAASDIWNGIKTTVVNAATSLKDAAVGAFKKLVSGIGDALSGLGSVVKKGFQSAIDFITGLPQKALKWGSDFINGIADGIRGAIGAVTDAVSGVADKIRSFLHFSRPDEGPLREYEKWMPDFVEGLVKGIYQTEGKVAEAVKSMAKGMQLNMNPSQNVITENGGFGQNIFDLLTSYLPMLAQGLDIDIVLDDGTLVGKMMPKINRNLGQAQANNSRGRSS